MTQWMLTLAVLIGSILVSCKSEPISTEMKLIRESKLLYFALFDARSDSPHEEWPSSLGEASAWIALSEKSTNAKVDLSGWIYRAPAENESNPVILIKKTPVATVTVKKEGQIRLDRMERPP